jgi:hypothetical protein
MKTSEAKRLSCLTAATFLLTTASALAATPDWQMVGENDRYSVWVDAGSLQLDGNIVKAWTKLEYKAARPVPGGSGKTQLSTRRREYLNCLARSSALKSAVSFPESNLNGAQVASFTVDDSEMEWDDAAPNSVGEAVLEFACSKALKQ